MFTKIDETKYPEQVVTCFDKESGLKAIIAIDNTKLGPALGGTRMRPYGTYDEALTDVLRLARGMTYKSAVSGLNLGGGKAVIIGDPRKDKSEALFRSLGRFVDSLGGRYITAQDIGTGFQEMDWINMETRHVVEMRHTSGDPGAATAYGVYLAMKASAKFAYGNESLAGKRVAIQGVGKVGSGLVDYLSKEGAIITIADVYEEAVKNIARNYKVNVTDTDKITEVECDIMAPAALGAIWNDKSIPKLKCSIIAGSANNQLAEDRHGDELHKKGILYAPDFVINAGAVINASYELCDGGYNKDSAYARIEGIYDTTWNVFNKSREENIPTYKAANCLAEARINKIAAIRSNYIAGQKPGPNHV